MKTIPEIGLSQDELFAKLESYRLNDVPWRDGRTLAYVYDPGKEAEEIIKRAFTLYLTENALDPTVFPSTLRLENELVAMATTHLSGDSQVCGNFTSGGTESIILAVKVARDRARMLRPHVLRPQVVLPVTAHAAFQKACHYLGVEPVAVPVDPHSYKADPVLMRRAITKDTILMVGSAVSYAHGVVDPIGELGRIAQEHELLLHVDACIGGFLLPYFRRLGCPVPDFDFRVPGVTSISMDFHKYAFAAKGASVILYRSPELRRYQIYACSNWTGYTLINPTLQSSKSGGPLAAAWAALHFIGDHGYLEIARQVLDATQRVAAGVEGIKGLRLLGQPQMNLLAIASDEVSVFHVIDEMRQRGWYLQPQLRFESSPENIHLSINPATVRWVERLLADLRECVEQARSMKRGELAVRVRESLSSLAPQGLGADSLRGLLAMAGIRGSSLPTRMAEINEVLNALPVTLRERLLVEYLNELYREPSDSGA